ncbi:hypothetical protein GCM10008955_42360 [Deinococcus malanensis]|uniref:Integrase catalytic domain-containing protein n=2 Tax=Deinococcus malanensis TaxID=1706855 RepID=A0ABQ2F2Q4_9DEIO|nr:hypothetical protein GCM10008955_42360 [Deinococcus malanensis]
MSHLVVVILGVLNSVYAQLVQPQSALEAQGARSSMGKKGDCFDNAVVESFFSTLKRELLLDRVFQTRQEGRLQVFEYLEVFYNRQRQHSTLGYKTPVEFEQVMEHKAA